MLDTDTTIQFYSDLKGNPLQGGKVYIGVAGQNPVTSPVTVYWDAAATQPAQQPIAVKNGTTTRNGSPARIFISGDYSKLVQDSKGRQISFDASLPAPLRSSLAGSGGSSLIGFSQSASYAAGSLGAKAQGLVSVKDAPFNAKGDGITDDTAAIAAAVAYVAGSGGGTLYFPRGKYIGSVLLQDVSNVTLCGDGDASEIHEPTQSVDGASVVVLKAKTVDISNITIRDLKISGPAFDDAHDAFGIECNRSTSECPFLAYNVQVHNCTVTNVRSAGVVLRQVIDAKVMHNRIYDTGRDGVQVSGTALVEGNYINNTGDDGVGALGPFAAHGFTPSYRIVSNNIGVIRNGARGISVSGSRDTVVANNVLRGYGIFGILVARATTFGEEQYAASRVVVEGNIVLDAAYAAVQAGIGFIGTTDQGTFPADNFTDYPLRSTLSTTDNQPVSHIRICNNYVGPSEWQGKTDAAGVTYCNPARGIRFCAGGSFQHIDISGNNLYGLSVTGLVTEMTTPANYGVAKMRVIGNDFLACQAGMTLVGGAPTGALWVNDYFLANNTIDGRNGLGYANPTGISAFGVRKLFITGCAFSNVTQSLNTSNSSTSANNNSFDNAPTFGTVTHTYASGTNAWTEA